MASVATASASVPTQYTSQTIAAPTDLAFDFEQFVRDELGLTLGVKPTKGRSPTTRYPLGMATHRSRDIEIEGEPCRFFLMGKCRAGDACPQPHVKQDKSIMCKHWLRGLCKKGDACEFLHEYDLKKMPECWFFTNYGECSNPECMYLHIDPDSKTKECPWYLRGFCQKGIFVYFY